MDTEHLRAKAAADMDPPASALVIQASPRGPKGWTGHCLEYLVKGMSGAGLKPEILYLKDFKVRPCLGCFACWERTPGVCIQKNDDMAELNARIDAAELLIYATPLYFYSVPGPLKNLLDRTLPLAQPYMIADPRGLTDHPRRNPAPARVAVLSVCGFPEPDHFAPMLAMFRAQCRSPHSLLTGEVLRPGAEFMSNHTLFEKRYQKAMAGIERAGRELAEQGWVSAEAEAQAATPFYDDVEAARVMTNAFWDSAAAYHAAKREGQDPGPYQDYLSAQPALILAGMAAGMPAEAAGGLSATVQFIISDRQPGEHYLRISSGRCRYRPGLAREADLTIETPWSVWMEIAQGKRSGFWSLLTGKYKVKGDKALLRKLGKIFG